MTPQMLIFSKTMNLNLQRPNEEKKRSPKVPPREGNKVDNSDFTIIDPNVPMYLIEQYRSELNRRFKKNLFTKRVGEY